MSLGRVHFETFNVRVDIVDLDECLGNHRPWCRIDVLFLESGSVAFIFLSVNNIQGVCIHKITSKLFLVPESVCSKNCTISKETYDAIIIFFYLHSA